MGGDAKSVQHTVVHPMYVSYSSIPSSTANSTIKSTKLLTKPFVDVTATAASTKSMTDFTNDYSMFFNNNNFNNNSKKDNNHIIYNEKNSQNSIGSLNLKPMNEANCHSGANLLSRNHCNCKCHLNVSDNSSSSRNSFVSMDQNIVNGNFYGGNNGFINDNGSRGLGVVGNMLIPRELDFMELQKPTMVDQMNFSRTKLVYRPSDSSEFSVNRFRHHFNDANYRCVVVGDNLAPVHEHSNYNLSPLPPPRHAPFARRDLNLTNYSNEIRDLPPDYLLRTYAVKRTQSHDRLVNHQRMNARKKSRPKSYCSNGNYVTPV